MIVDDKKLLDWIENTFDSYKPYKSDYLVNSPFKEDKKFKLSISPSKNCFHCWKSDASGPIWKLIMTLDKCTKQEAINKICKETDIQEFDSKIASLKEKIKNKSEEKQLIVPHYQNLSFDNNPINIKVLKYLHKRKIDLFRWKIGYCTEGKYKNRMIIPFFRDGKCIYWIARSLMNQEPKYLNPDTPKENIIFSESWKFNNDVFICEGVFNAITLIQLGFNAIAIQGKHISQYQYSLIKDAKTIIFAFDNDSPGRKALGKNIEYIKSLGRREAFYIFPNKENLDWNDLIQIEEESKMKEYILTNVKKYDLKSEIIFKLKEQK